MKTEDPPIIARLDHTAIAVPDHAAAARFFTDVLGALPGTDGEDEALRYRWQVFSPGDLSRLELISSTGTGSFLDNFFKTRPGGVHHLTFQTPDITRAKAHLEAHGIPHFGYQDYGGVWKELFIHPRDAFGVLIQIAEFNPRDWLHPEVRNHEPWRVERQGADTILEVAHPGGGKVRIVLDAEQRRRLTAALAD